MRIEPDERFRCRCGAGPATRGCQNRATREDLRCDDCRVPGDHGHLWFNDEWAGVGHNFAVIHDSRHAAQPR